MRRCPTCNRTFEDQWLGFCTEDGTALVDTSALPSEPPPTIVGPPSARETNPAGQPTLDLPGSYIPPQSSYVPPQSTPQSPAPAWKPSPPIAYTVAPQQSLAIVSLALGIFSITIGWCCYLGVITGPIAIALGGYQLTQIKKDPSKFGGKPLAIVGVVAGLAYFLGLVFIVLIYGLSFLMKGVT